MTGMSGVRLIDSLHHIHQTATDACGFIEGMTEADFLADKRTQQAVVMSLIIVGEAATHIIDRYPEFSAEQATIPWRSMRGMRNRIAHGNFDIDLEVVWQTVKTALPELLAKLPAVQSLAGAHDPSSQ